MAPTCRSLITGAGLFAMFLFLGLYLQVIKQYTPVQAGFAFLPFSLGIILAAGIAANLHAQGRAPAADGPRPARGRPRHVLADPARPRSRTT